MIVELGSGAVPRLIEADNFKALKVVAPASGDVTALLGPLGHVDGDAVWLDAARFKALGPSDAAWRESFSQMLEKAAKYGWVDPATGALRAHIERV